MRRPCLRMNLDLLDSSANGTAIVCFSSSVRTSRSISRSVSASSSTPRMAQLMYQSHTTRRRTREKNRVHSSRLGGPALAARGLSVLALSKGFRRLPLLEDASSASSSGTIIASTIASESSLAKSVSSANGCASGIGCSVRPSASIASGVRPVCAGFGMSAMRYHYLCRLVCWALLLE